MTYASRMTPYEKPYIQKYLCGKRALDYWKVPHVRGNLELEETVFPLEYVIFTSKPLYRPQRALLRTCRIPGAEKYTQQGVCTLPLVFLQVANDYSIHELIYLGLQICSYRENQPPLCTVKELRQCAEKLHGHRGRRKALRAIRYLDEGSRSPMESILYMMLRLPNALGGCGFTEIKLNHKIQLKKSRHIYYADLYVPSCKLDIEYDSQTYHNKPEAFSKDAIRSAHLEAEGYQVISVRPEQLVDLKHFETLARNLSRRIGKQIRIRARKFIESFTALRDLLLNKACAIRSRFKRTRYLEIPRFPGISAIYELYSAAWTRLARYPNRSLVLTRAP